MRAHPTDASEPEGKTHEFSPTGYVIERSTRRELYVGGSLVGWFEADDVAMRNFLLCAASRGADVSMPRLAEAFGISPPMARNIRRRYRQQGVQAIVERRQTGRKQKLTAELQARLNDLFDRELTIDEAHEKLGRCISRTLVGRAHKRWADARNALTPEGQGRAHKVKPEQPDATEAGSSTDDQTPVVVARERRAVAPSVTVVGPADQRPMASVFGESETTSDVTASAVRAVSAVPITSVQRGAEPKRVDESETRSGEPASVGTASGGPVQHLGTWLMLAMVHALGVYRIAEVLRQNAVKELAGTRKQFIRATTLRLAIGAVIIALSIGQQTVEGVRRLATPCLPILLRTRRRGPLSASWTRRILGRFSEKYSDPFRMAVATTLIQENEGNAGVAKRVVFYIDNHLRPYTGKHKIRRGWRMQSKRAVPGNADFWVHDEDGRPVLRMDSPEHESLVAWLRRIGRLIREALKDEDVKILLVFDRAGAYPQEMAQLRDEGFEFATYERGPIAPIAASAYERQIELGDELYGLAEVHNKNLGKGRGRVRRISLRTAEGEQVNVLAVSEASAEQLVTYMTRRWACQENQFKHGVERWGINQLDGRRVEPYPSDAIIPNPARARVERALRLARAAEGEALRRLQKMDPTDPKRERVERDLKRARRQQREFEEIRPRVPKHAPVKDTELSGELMRHKQKYKHAVDAIRIALANAEAELAARLGPLLARPTEAKRTLANLLSASGTVMEGLDTIDVTLAPAGTSSEQRAFRQFLDQINELPLSLPGDPGQRRLRFQVIIE